MRYVHMYAGTDGESHFEDVEVPMDAVTTTTGVSTTKGSSGPIGGALTFISPDLASGDPGSPSLGDWGPWHPESPTRFVVLLEGEVDVEVSDGEVRRFGPGKLLLANDTVGKGHRNRPLSAKMRSIFIPLAPTAPA
jgi:hypothetical protein